jgi:CPA2 family monovalent cation:H+ antiporter-2
MHESELTLTRAGGLPFARAQGFITQKIGLSLIVGYLLAGSAAGSSTPGFVADQGSR